MSSPLAEKVKKHFYNKFLENDPKMCFESYILPGCYTKFLKWLVYSGINCTRKESNHTSNQGCSRKLYYDNGNNDNNGKDHYKY